MSQLVNEEGPRPPGAPHPAIQVRGEDWPGVLSDLQRKQFKKTGQRFTPETFEAYLNSQKDIPWSKKFLDAGDDDAIFRVLNIMRDGPDYKPNANPKLKANLLKSKEFYESLIQNLPGIVQNDPTETAKQIFG